MAEDGAPPPAASDTQVGDRDIDVRGIVRFGVGLLVFTAAMFAVSWVFSAALKGRLVRREPPAPPLIEARAAQLPPEPRLQPAPDADMAALRARDQRVLTTYGWTSPERTTARIPVSRAIEILAERGLPTPTGAAPETRR